MGGTDSSLAAARAFADPLRAFVQRIRAEEAGTYAHTPRAGSEAKAELDNDLERSDGAAWGAEPVADAQAMPGLRLFAADDHLFALSELVGSPHSMLGWAVACRNVLEAASRAWWLLEPRLGARARVVRHHADWFQSEMFRGNLLSGIGGASAPAGTGHVLESARRLGISVDEVGQGTLFDGVRVPPPAKLVHGLLDDAGFDAGEGFYRYLSGTTHGDRQAIVDILDARREGSGGGPGIDRVRFIVQVTLTGYTAAVLRSWAYQAWDVATVRGFLKDAIDALAGS